MWTIKEKRKNKKCTATDTKQPDAQVSLEFLFGMIVILLAMYGAMMIFRWAGVSLVERRMVHEKVLLLDVVEGWTMSTIGNSPLRQVDPQFYKMRRMCAVFGDCWAIPK